MGYTIYEAGRTGPSAHIGGSSPYHIDSKFSTSLGEDEARRRFEAKVGKYNELGRVVEFSNQGVAGRVYDLSAPEEERANLFRSAYGAHAPREGFYSLDYYAPNKGKNRWDASAEGAPIFAVGEEGGRRETGTGGNYGYYSLLYNKDGVLTGKVGHGDARYPGGGVISADPSTPSPTADLETLPATVDTASPTVDTAMPTAATPDFSGMTKSQINEEYDRLRMAGDVFKAQEVGMNMHNAFFNK